MSNIFKTPDLCDHFSSDLQIALPGFNDYGGKTHFGGPVTTLKLFENNMLVRKQLETKGAGHVLVVDGGGSNRCALLGDMLAELAVENGWAGIVLYGYIRDVEEIGKLDLGVKALGVMPLKSIKRDEGQIDIPVTFHGVTFNPGNYIYCDPNGIVLAEQDISSR